MVEFVDRSNSDNEKWGGLKKYFGRDDILAFWVADMDFATPLGVQKALKKELSKKAFGYEEIGDDFYEAVINWYKKRHNTVVEKEWIVPIPSVVSALNISAKLWGDNGVLIQPPVYEKFNKAIKLNGVKKVSSPLLKDNGKYKIAYPLPKASVALFCSPQNPTGRVWDKEELEAFAKEAREQDMIVVSDEIHSDIVYSKTHHPFINFYDKTVLITAVNKTFNVAKFGGGYAIIPNEELRAEFKGFLDSLHLSLSPTSAKILEAAYREEAWVDELIEVLEQNIEYIDKHLTPKIRRSRPEGTYLMWLDFSEFGLSDRELREKMVNEAKLALNSGTNYGKEGHQYMRFNFATSLELVKEAVDRINRVFG